MRLKRLIFGLLIALAPTPGRADVALLSAEYQGDGCPPGTAYINVAPDAQAFTVTFGQYGVVAGASAGRPQQRKTCNLDLAFAVTPGWTFAVDSVDFRGYASLDPRTYGQQVSSLTYPPRTALTRLAALDLAGPFDDNFAHHVAVPAAGRIFAPCVGTERRMLLRTNAGVTAPRPGTNALMTVDSVDGVLSHRYHLAWQRCP